VSSAPITINYPRVKVDTDGRGSFNGMFNAQIRRGWVDTRGEVQVGFTGPNFRVMFYGQVESFDGDRQLTVRIYRSDRGDARGRAQIRLNRDRNEVEMITINGRNQGADFSGNFNRN
jgi:hypothetical protein